LIGLTSLMTDGGPPVPPKLNRPRALFVMGKIDEILAWEKSEDQGREVRFVELGRYLCEVRLGQYWRLGNLSLTGRGQSGLLAGPSTLFTEQQESLRWSRDHVGLNLRSRPG
jgi:hypothetical protein